MYELALFAGAGGGLLASKWLLGHRVVCYVESDAYCQRVIRARIADGLLDDAPIWDDARTFDGSPWRGRVDIVSAGFPCQPFSVAGKRRGEDDERNLWPDTIRIVREVQPRLVFLENVPGLLAGHGYFGRVLGDLAAAGFDAEWCVLSAADIGANHLRKRLWILAYAPELLVRQEPRTGVDESRYPRAGALPGKGAVLAHAAGKQGGREGDRGVGRTARAGRDDVADARESRLAQREGERGDAREELTTSERDGGDVPDADGGGGAPMSTGVPSRPGDWWQAEPDVGRVAHGVASRVDRLRALGNGQVSIVAARAFRLLLAKIEEETKR